ncbi:hypothetical protein [Vagococcus fluvialis]|uniref:hypothetical protein n=1 Tax=Vagococcus fluvialis TaxID=2738 RepID=UPI001D0BBD7B|nr:hypothetical protein [Vagococcus fluvialis]UDM73279.1 hypothetical protein K5K99_10110 [Vagococcus fluvialis]
MKLLRNGETVEQPIELILPMYVHHKYKLMWNDIEMTFEQLDNLKSLINEFKTVAAIDYIVRNLSEDERKTFELLTHIKPFNAREIDIFNLQPNENSVALKFISKGKGFDSAYLNEKLASMYPGKKSIPKKAYKSLLESLENGLIKVQRQVTVRELFLEDMLI